MQRSDDDSHAGGHKKTSHGAGGTSDPFVYATGYNGVLIHPKRPWPPMIGRNAVWIAVAVASVIVIGVPFYLQDSLDAAVCQFSMIAVNITRGP